MGMSSASVKRHRPVSAGSGNQGLATSWKEHGRLSLRASATLLFAASFTGWGVIYGVFALSF